MSELFVKDGELKTAGGVVHTYSVYKGSELLALFTSYQDTRKYLDENEPKSNKPFRMRPGNFREKVEEARQNGVCLDYSDELCVGEYLWHICVFSDPGYWITSFKTKEACLKYCEKMGMEVKEPE